MVDFEASNSKSEVSKSKFVDNYFFLENYVTPEGTVPHNVLYHQSLPITRHQVSILFNISCFARQLRYLVLPHVNVSQERLRLCSYRANSTGIQSSQHIATFYTNK